jgi:hypothetical protein
VSRVAGSCSAEGQHRVSQSIAVSGRSEHGWVAGYCWVVGGQYDDESSRMRMKLLFAGLGYSSNAFRDEKIRSQGAIKNERIEEQRTR